MHCTFVYIHSVTIIYILLCENHVLVCNHPGERADFRPFGRRLRPSVNVVFALSGVTAVLLGHEGDHEDHAQQPHPAPEPQYPACTTKVMMNKTSSEKNIKEQENLTRCDFWGRMTRTFCLILSYLRLFSNW